VSTDSTHALATKRLVIGHLTVCQGCCCGNTENGRPPVPVDWLKKEWRAKGLLKRVQLTISGCLGPCDLPNVVTISNESGTQWFGEITEFEHIGRLLTGPLGPEMRVNSCPFQENLSDILSIHFASKNARGRAPGAASRCFEYYDLTSTVSGFAL
jgi:(2Fe-2S) ferredoxin